jgi:hypothetical protein
MEKHKGLKQQVKSGDVDASAALYLLGAQGEIARQSKTYAWLNRRVKKEVQS